MLEEYRVANLKLRDIEDSIWKFITLRCRNNFQERELLYRILNRPRPALHANEFQRCVKKSMKISMGPKILDEFVARYGYNDGLDELISIAGFQPGLVLQKNPKKSSVTKEVLN